MTLYFIPGTGLLKYKSWSFGVSILQLAALRLLVIVREVSISRDKETGGAGND